MMRHSIVIMGRLRRPFFREGAEEYCKRLQAYGRVQLVEVPEAKQARSADDPQAVRESEAEAILGAAEQRGVGYWIALDEAGRMATSEGLARFLEKRAVGGDSHLIWLIGGAFGLSEEVKQRCNLALSLSRMTFPHEMVPMILLEQLYRAHRIMRGEPYHH